MSSEPVNRPERVIAYIDGFNLYFGLRSKRWAKYYWLDICALCESLLIPGQTLAATKYFTSRISGPKDKQARQTKFLDAIQANGTLSVFYGKYQTNEQRCRTCGNVARIPQEKMTDVNIATEMLVDAFSGSMDTALLVSADSDLVGPVRAVRRLFAAKRVVACFPPGRSSKALKQAASAWITIGRDSLSASQMPKTVRLQSGYLIERPDEWE